MRTIKFRGKRKDTGEWVYGDLHKNTMDNEDFVTFETAKLLKENGFSEKVTSVYIHVYYGDNGWRLRDGYNKDDYNHHEWFGIFSAPTLWEAQKWLRDNKKLHVLVDFNIVGTWFYKVFPIIGCCVNESFLGFPTYEAALSAGIDSSLDLITNKTE